MRFCLASVEQVFKCGFLTKLPLLSVPFVSAKMFGWFSSENSQNSVLK